MPDVEILEVDEKPNRFVVFAKVNNNTFTHVFPGNDGWKELDDDGVPAFVKELVNIYDKRTAQMQASKSAKNYEGESFSIEERVDDANIRHQS